MSATPDSPPDTRQRLLIAAIKVFADKGFQGAGIREIALKAQANSALVQYYFGGKEGLYDAALRFLFDHPGRGVANLPPPPEDRTALLAHFRLYIGTFLQELMGHHCSEMIDAEEFFRAAHLFWSRELLDPAPERLAMIKEHLGPYVQQVSRCVALLRPDFDPDTAFYMAASVNAQIVFMHAHRHTLRLFRERPIVPEDLEALTDHITAFSLRGLGVPEAFPPFAPRS